jgi:hypothetical protein
MVQWNAMNYVADISLQRTNIRTSPAVVKWIFSIHGPVANCQSFHRSDGICSEDWQRSNIPAHALILRYADIDMSVQCPYRHVFEIAACQAKVE